MSKKQQNPNTGNHTSPLPVKQSSLRWAYIVLFSFAVLLYANTFNHKFAFDDSVVITGNKYTLQGFSGIKTLATKDLFYGIYGTSLDLEGGRWRPLTLIMFAVEYQFFGDNATPYHGINILLYGITAMVLFMTLLEVLPGKSRVLLSFTTTLLYVAHPIHTEVVANIKSRDEIVSFLFLCLTLFFLFRYVTSAASADNWRSQRAPLRRVRDLLLSVICYFTALLSKESGITFVSVIPLSLFCFSNKNIRQSMMLTIPFFITAGIYFAIRTSLVGIIGDRESNDITDNPFLQLNFPELPTPIPFSDKFATCCWILLKYLLLLIFPHPLTSDYGFNHIPVIGLSDPKAVVSILIYSGLIAYAGKILLEELKIPRNLDLKREVSVKVVFAYCILFFFFTIIIVSNLFFLIGTTMGERFAYISSLGFCLASAALIIKIFKWKSFVLQDCYSSAKKLYPLLIVIIPYSYKTVTRNPAWADNKTLFTTDVKTSTGSANAHYYFANTIFTEHINDDPSLKRDSLFAEAKREFLIAIGINPHFHYCYYNMGLIWEKLGNADSAIFYQQKTLNLKPENAMAQYMAKGALGLVYGKLKGDYERAIPLLKEALQYRPEDTGYHENLGICYALKGDFDSSIKEFETSLKLKTRLEKIDARIFMNMALSWQQKGNKEKSDENFAKAFQLDPSLKK